MLAEAVEVGGVFVCAVGRAVVAVCEGGEEEVLHVEVEGVLVGVAVGGEGDVGGDGGGGCALEGGGGVGGLGVVGVEAEVVEGMGWVGGEVGRLPGSEFHGDGSGAGGAGEAKALWEAAGVVGAEFAVLCVDDADAVDEVLGFEFDKAGGGAAEGAEGEALLFWCDAVEEFFFVVVDLGEAGVAVLDVHLRQWQGGSW